MITVNVAASVSEMALISTIKDELGITTDTDDAVLANYVRRASALIERYTGRKFARETVTETMPAFGSRRMLLSRRPIVSITHVKLSGTTQSSTSYSIEDADAGILWRANGWSPTTQYNSFITTHPSGDGRLDWEVKYVAGYIMPGSTAGECTLPADLEFATCEMVKSWYLSKSDNSDIASQRVGDSSETRSQTMESWGIPPIAQTLLSRWRSADIT